MSVTAPPRPPRPQDPADLEALEALIEEARRRARRRRRWYGACALIAAAAATVGFFGFREGGGDRSQQAISPNGSGERGPRTQLTVLAVNQNVGRAVFRLSCAPAGGDVPAPAHACAALAANPELITNPEPYVCWGGLSSWWDITISGRFRGRAVRTQTSSCWTSQMELIGKLGIAPTLYDHLLPRRRERLIGGQQRTFPPGALRPGDLVICKIRDRRLETGVPNRVENGGSSTGYDGGVGVTTVTLTVVRHRDGSVTASCL